MLLGLSFKVLSLLRYIPGFRRVDAAAVSLNEVGELGANASSHVSAGLVLGHVGSPGRLEQSDAILPMFFFFLTNPDVSVEHLIPRAGMEEKAPGRRPLKSSQGKCWLRPRLLYCVLERFKLCLQVWRTWLVDSFGACEEKNPEDSGMTIYIQRRQ